MDGGVMRRSTALVAIAVCLPALADPAPRWTFCVASSKSGADVWITGVFLAEQARGRLESAFKAMVERSVASADAQCPLPREDKTEAVNAQFEAEEFNRKLGATLHAVFAGEFPPRR
ncbi:MAG TPA: hypothetical protein VKA12_13230 [Roseiarcus sp.]|nr:hypothetical protein [Roseiarcus sp.]